MVYKTRQDILDENYRKVEAMYRRKLSVEEIIKRTKLSKMDVLDIIQKIHHLDMKAKGFR